MSEFIANISQAEYDDFCDTTDQCLTNDSYPDLMYYALGFAGEAGEVANKIKKIYRDDNGVIEPERRDMIIRELGGVVWYYSRICKRLGITPDQIRQANYAELFSRRERGTILGDGDNR